MKIVLVCLVLLVAACCSCPPDPYAGLPYHNLLRHEPRFVKWWQETQSRRPLSDFIEDASQPTYDRQRAWQFRKKVRGY
jgi:hypothetical protein